MTRHLADHDRRNHQILADVVRVYIETGEPVSSRQVAQLQADSLSPATIRHVMSDLEQEGYLYQPHTSAGRVPTQSAYRSYVQQLGQKASLSPDDRDWIRRELASAATPQEVMERASHVLAALSQGLGIVVSPPTGSAAIEHVRFLLLPDGRIVTVLVSRGGATRDKMIHPQRAFTQADLDRIAGYLNQNFSGWTLRAIRAHLLARLKSEREEYDRLLRDALILCDASEEGVEGRPEVYVEGAAQIATAPEFADQAPLRELLAAIEEKEKLVSLLSACIESPEPVSIQIGIKEISTAGEHLALIGAPYGAGDQAQGSVGVLGPLRMQYERAITAVAYVAKLFDQTLGKD